VVLLTFVTVAVASRHHVTPRDPVDASVTSTRLRALDAGTDAHAYEDQPTTDVPVERAQVTRHHTHRSSSDLLAPDETIYRRHRRDPREHR
jgi:hypothetical protein